jgi:uncharacterized protein YndB with AHSA1/START domain
MTQHSANHTTFVIVRSYEASPARVFAAFADPAIKARWFKGPDEWDSGSKEFDFRVGGRERSSGGPKEGPKHIFDCLYWDIVPNERIVYSYDMHLDDNRISVSLATIELKREGRGTRLVFTEQGVFLDGLDDPASREHGTGWLLDKLGAELQRQAV